MKTVNRTISMTPFSAKASGIRSHSQPSCGHESRFVTAEGAEVAENEWVQGPFQRRDRQGAFPGIRAVVAIPSNALPNGRASDSRFFGLYR